jgi:hypothetical protein
MTCILAAFAVLAVEGQSIKVGGEFGTNWSRFSNDPNNFKSDARTGYQAGLSLRFGSKVYFQPEFQCVWTKSELTEPFDIGVPFSQEYDVHSFRVPVQLGYKLVGNDKVNMRLFTGPVFNFNFDSQNPQSQIPVQDLKPFNTALRFGGGFDLWLFNVDVSYDLGITDAFENSNSKFRGINAELGIHIPIK